MDQHDVATQLKSDALKANLLETAGEVKIPSEILMLLEPVEKYRGLHTSLEKLLYELCHPFRNWKIILPQLRSFALKNTRYYYGYDKGEVAISHYANFFFEAIEDLGRDPVLQGQAVAALLVWLEKTIAALPEEQRQRFQPTINAILLRLEGLAEKNETAFMQVVYGQQSITGLVNATMKAGEFGDYSAVLKFLGRVLESTYLYWLGEDDPLAWFLAKCQIVVKDSTISQLFHDISHVSLGMHKKELLSLCHEDASYATMQSLTKLPFHVDIVRSYRAMPTSLAKADEAFMQLADETGGHRHQFKENRKILFLFKIMDTAGLHLIHEETLREINRSLVQLIRQQTFEEIEEFLLTTFQLLQANVKKYPHTSLQCIQVLGGEVFDRGNSRMVEAFLWGVVRFGFQHASVVGVDENWQPIANPAHLANIRVWLHLIMREPKWCSTLFSALIIHLKLSGTCVKDTDLFQRDITELLNHPIEPIYNLSKQFAKLMPVFFNEIGSEGELRDVSTELDEIHKRKDVLIHFFRKQCHVESSNLIVDFAKAIFTFWRTKSRDALKAYVPEELLPTLGVAGKYMDGPHFLITRMWDELELESIDELLDVESTDITTFLSYQKDVAESERRRFELMVEMFKLLHSKYELGFQRLRPELLYAAKNGFPEMKDLLTQLEGDDVRENLGAILDNLIHLKEVILSEEKFEAREDIYFKRHIAVDIPSVYGAYKERKFDSLSLSFRLENLANVYLENLADTVNLAMITQATFYDIIACLKLYMQALAVDGIGSRKMQTYISLLENSLKVKRFSYTQYIDIFKGLSEGVKDIIYAYYTNNHQNNLSLIVPQLNEDNLLYKYHSLYDKEDMGSTVHRLSETFLRELIATTFGLQHLDNFIIRVIQTLESQKDMLSEDHLDQLMTFNPNRSLSYLDEPNPFTHNLIHLGNKGFNLAQLSADGKPVPPAFVITTEVFRCRDIVFGYAEARSQFFGKVMKYLHKLERKTGRVFGSSDNPLLLSVRSGGSISMPGMMATVHNVGFSERNIKAYVKKTGEGFVAWDNYRRFIQSWAMICGVDRDDFQVVMNAAKSKHSVKLKRDFSGEQMCDLALAYRDVARQHKIDIPDDPWWQLVRSIELVLDSWNTKKAVDYRRIMNLSDSWGTAVIIQTMVYGNKSNRAGSGVVFTSHPYRKVQRVALWGDYSYGNQGEDIVSGLVTSYAISVEQAELDGRSVDKTLERRFPEIYKELLAVSRELVYEKRWNPQEIEFTFEGETADELYLLQTRDMITIKKKEHLQVFDGIEELEKSYLGKGVGVSGSALSGIAVFTEENIIQMRAQYPETPLILIRQDTVPEDIKVIDMADGLLTSRGGQTSHASVVAVRLEKHCVVGCRKLRVSETQHYCEIKGHRISFGDKVSIDGRSGHLYWGQHSIREEYHILPI